MAEIAWVRKYRPSSFDDYMGDNIKKMVINRFSNRDSIPQTIMLYGTRGTGKTSMARLLAKEIHCMSPVNGHSCGQCDMCREIDEYISSTEAGAECPGITEVDAATTTGKSDINDIIEEALILPMYPLKYKILILDECHMLSVSAQNSLLKVIEEPPQHLIFILCTTDPEKVIGTIHSRIQLKLEVKKKTVSEMVQKLLWIAHQEDLTTSEQALQIIAKKGERIPRECINLLELVAKNYANKVTVENVREAVGDLSTEIYMDFYKAANDSLSSILNFNKTLKDKDVNPKDFIKGLTRFTLDALYVKFGINLADYSVDFVKQIKPLFNFYTISDCDTILQILNLAQLGMTTEDTSNELIITLTAIRVGKVELLSKGLYNSDEAAKNENIFSLKKYAGIIEEQKREAIEKIPETEINKEAFAQIFTHMTEVADGDSVILDQTSTSNTSENPNEAESVDDRTQRIISLFDSD